MTASESTDLRRTRERELVSATRTLFDERGMQSAPIDEIARAVGIARGLIYRHFSSKEELYVLTVTSYLEELDGALCAAIATTGRPASQLEQWARAYAEFCCRYPAFLDCTLSLMRRPATDLQASISDSVWLRLGQGMARCINHVSSLLREADDQGVLSVSDPDYTANVLWTQMLGTMHLTRLGVGLRQAAPGIPALFSISPDRVVETCIDNALTTAGMKR